MILCACTRESACVEWGMNTREHVGGGGGGTRGRSEEDAVRLALPGIKAFAIENREGGRR